MHRLLVLAVLVLVLSASVASAEMAAPPNLVDITAAGTPVNLWPYTYQVPDAEGVASDPINLVFVDSDPREIRQALMKLTAGRPAPFTPETGANCLWSDAMGSEQAAYAGGDWAGSEVQLVCTDPGLPFGNPFRIHLRLFRFPDVTLGAAHFEFLIPGTAQHAVLSWDLARNFVTYDMARTGKLTATPSPVPVTAGTSFRHVLRPIWNGLVASGAEPLLAGLGFQLPPAPGNVPIPTDGAAIVLMPNIVLEPKQAKIELAYDANYDVVTTKPFCNAPTDYVKLMGPVKFQTRVHTNPSGKYERVYQVSGTLTVIPLTPSATGLVPAGAPLQAEISEYHRALLTDNYGQVTEQTLQTLLAAVPQSQSTSLNAGQFDEVGVSTVCTLP